MPAAHLKKIREKASEMHRKNPRLSYQSALKQAGKLYRQGKIGGRKSGKGKKKTKGSYVPVKATHCRKISGVADHTLAQTLARARSRLTEELGWLMATQKTARTKKEKKALQPKITELSRKLRVLK